MQDSDLSKGEEKRKVMLINQNKFFNDFKSSYNLFFIIQKLDSNTK